MRRKSAIIATKIKIKKNSIQIQLEIFSFTEISPSELALAVLVQGNSYMKL